MPPTNDASNRPRSARPGRLRLAVAALPAASAVRRRGRWQPALALAVTWLVSGALATGLATPHHHHHDHAVPTRAGRHPW